MAWWQQIKESRRRTGKQRINTWERLKNHMRQAFLPYNYDRTLYNKLQSLRQGARTVDEDATDFFNMVARITLIETEDQLIARFIGGLRYQIQIAMQQFNPLTISEAHQRALAIEIQYRSSWNTGTSRNRAPAQNADTSTASGSDTSQARVTSSKTNTMAPSDSIVQSRPART